MEIIPAGIDENSKHFLAYMNNIEDLAAYVLRICKEKDLSLNEIERRSGRKGFKITQGYISKIVSGAAQNVSVDKLRALAAGLGRPEEEVFAVARGEQLILEQINQSIAKAMFFKYSQLPAKDKEELATLLKALDREIEERLRKHKK